LTLKRFLNVITFFMIMSEKGEKSRFEEWYNKYYKLVFIIPIALLVLSIVYLASFYAKTGDIFNKDVTLTGGTTITVHTDQKIDVQDITAKLSKKIEEPSIRILTDIRTGKQVSFSVETKTESPAVKAALEEYLGYSLTEENSSIEFTGSNLSKSFYSELMMAMVLAFLLMAVVIFVIFRSPMPCFYVILCAATDIIVPMAIVNLVGIKISTAGIAAFLMLIGYSVDTDILLTTRVLKRRDDPLFKRITGAMKTGLTMSLTSLFAVFVAYFIAIPPVLKQVFIILTIGLCIDIIATWLGNASLLKWYCDKKNIV